METKDGDSGRKSQHRVSDADLEAGDAMCSPAGAPTGDGAGGGAGSQPASKRDAEEGNSGANEKRAPEVVKIGSGRGLLTGRGSSGSLGRLESGAGSPLVVAAGAKSPVVRLAPGETVHLLRAKVARALEDLRRVYHSCALDAGIAVDAGHTPRPASSGSATGVTDAGVVKSTAPGLQRAGWRAGDGNLSGGSVRNRGAVEEWAAWCEPGTYEARLDGDGAFEIHGLRRIGLQAQPKSCPCVNEGTVNAAVEACATLWSRIEGFPGSRRDLLATRSDSQRVLMAKSMHYAATVLRCFADVPLVRQSVANLVVWLSESASDKRVASVQDTDMMIMVLAMCLRSIVGSASCLGDLDDACPLLLVAVSNLCEPDPQKETFVAAGGIEPVAKLIALTGAAEPSVVAALRVLDTLAFGFSVKPFVGAIEHNVIAFVDRILQRHLSEDAGFTSMALNTAVLSVASSLAFGSWENSVLCADSGLVTSIQQVMWKHRGSPSTQRYGCRALANVAAVSPPDGDADKLRKLVAGGGEGLQAILAAMAYHPRQQSVQRYACRAVAALVETGCFEICEQVATRGGIEMLLCAQERNLQDVAIQNHVAAAVAAMAESTIAGGPSDLSHPVTREAKVSEFIVGDGGIRSMVQSMEANITNSDVQQSCCSALEQLALRGHGQKVAKHGGIRALLGALTRHGHVSAVRKHGAVAVAAVSSTPENQLELVLEGGLIAVLRGLRDWAARGNASGTAETTTDSNLGAATPNSTAYSTGDMPATLISSAAVMPLVKDAAIPVVSGQLVAPAVMMASSVPRVATFHGVSKKHFVMFAAYGAAVLAVRMSHDNPLAVSAVTSTVLGTPYLGHASVVRDIAVSGPFLITASVGHVAAHHIKTSEKIWSIPTVMLSDGGAPFTRPRVAVLQDFAVLSWRDTFTLHEVRSGRQTFMSERARMPICSIRSKPSSGAIVTSGGQGLALWTLNPTKEQRGSMVLRYNLHHPVSVAEFDRGDSLSVFAGVELGADATLVRISADGIRRWTGVGHKNTIWCVIADTAAGILLSGSADGTVRAWLPNAEGSGTSSWCCDVGSFVSHIVLLPGSSSQRARRTTQVASDLRVRIAVATLAGDVLVLSGTHPQKHCGEPSVVIASRIQENLGLCRSISVDPSVDNAYFVMEGSIVCVHVPVDPRASKVLWSTRQRGIEFLQTSVDHQLGNAAASDNRKGVRLISWDTESDESPADGGLRWVANVQSHVTCLALSKPHQIVAAGASDASITCWTVESSDKRHEKTPLWRAAGDVSRGSIVAICVGDCQDNCEYCEGAGASVFVITSRSGASSRGAGTQGVAVSYRLSDSDGKQAGDERWQNTEVLSLTTRLKYMKCRSSSEPGMLLHYSISGILSTSVRDGSRVWLTTDTGWAIEPSGILSDYNNRVLFAPGNAIRCIDGNAGKLRWDVSVKAHRVTHDFTATFVYSASNGKSSYVSGSSGTQVELISTIQMWEADSGAPIASAIVPGEAENIYVVGQSLFVRSGNAVLIINAATLVLLHTVNSELPGQLVEIHVSHFDSDSTFGLLTSVWQPKRLFMLDLKGNTQSVDLMRLMSWHEVLRVRMWGSEHGWLDVLLAKYTNLADFVVIGSMLVLNFLQMMAFSMQGPAPPAIQTVAEQLSALQRFGIWVDGTTVLATMLCTVGLLALVFVSNETLELVTFLNPSKSRWKLIWEAAALFAKVCTSTLVLPIVRAGVETMDCTNRGNGTLTWDARVDGTECMSDDHLPYLLPALVALFVFVPLART